MTTAPLEHLDLEHLLDAEPECEAGCGREASHRVIWTCRCFPNLSCSPCVEDLIFHTARDMHDCDEFECVDCGLVQHPRSVSDLFRVEAL